MEGKSSKLFYEMDNRELFCVLTGDRGFMEQQLLQTIVRKYLAKHSQVDDLQTMVRSIIDEGEV